MDLKQPAGQRRLARHQLLWRALPLLAALVWTGCKQETNVAADRQVAGTYALVSVNGNKVPCALQHAGAAMQVKSGTFIIKLDGTCSSKVIFSGPAGGESIREVKAAYASQGSKLTMKWEGAGTTTGTVDGDTFTMNNEGMIFVYRK